MLTLSNYLHYSITLFWCFQMSYTSVRLGNLNASDVELYNFFHLIPFWIVARVIFEILLAQLGSLSERITSTPSCIRQNNYTRHKYFHWGNHKGENLANFLRTVQSQILYHNMNKPSNKNYSSAIYISPCLSLSTHAHLSECKCI